MTALYNVLTKERRNEDLDKKEREIYEKGLVGVLRELHDELGTAVVRAVMTHADEPLTVEQVAQHFHRPHRSDVRELLETLAALGHVEGMDDGAYAT